MISSHHLARITCGRSLMWVLCAASGLGLAGCGESSSAGTTYAQWDSAGVTIVNVAATPATPHWTTPAEPFLRIGVAEGRPEYVFGNVRFASRSRDGGVMVVDGQRGQVRFYDSRGTFLSQAGGIGQGPDHFDASVFYAFHPKLLRAGADSILIFDDRLGRLTVVGSDGTMSQVSSPGLPRTEGSQRKLVGALGNSALAFLLSGDAPELESLAVGDTFSHPSKVVVRSAEGEEQVIATLLGGLRVAVELQTDAAGTKIKSIYQMPLTHSVLAVAQRDRIVASRTDRYELMYFDPTGKLQRVVRRTDIVPVAIDNTVLSRYNAPESSGVNYFDGYVRPWPSMPLERLRNSHLPTHSALLFDDDGNLWVREPSFPWDEEEPTDWAVFSPTGEFLATASLPRGLVVYQVGRDFVVGRMTDELGVEYLGIFHLSI